MKPAAAVHQRQHAHVEKTDLKNQNKYGRQPLLPLQRIPHEVAEIQAKSDFEEWNQPAQWAVGTGGGSAPRGWVPAFSACG